MKVNDLLNLIQDGCKDYPDFLDWEIALEHVEKPTEDIDCKDDILIYKDFDGDWVFIKSHSMGCFTRFTNEKVLGLQVRY